MIDTSSLSPALTAIDGQFSQFGQQIQQADQQLQSMREERLRLQGRYAQRESDEVEINDLHATVDKLTADLATALATIKQHDQQISSFTPPDPAGDASPPEPLQPAADAATGE